MQGRLSNGRVGVDPTAAKWSAIFSALFHFVATVLIVIVIAFPADREGDCTPEKVRAFDEKCLRDEWNHMGDYRYLEFSYDLFGALGAFLLVPAVLVITDYFSRFSSSTRIMSFAFIFAAIVTTVEFLFRAGQYTTADWLAGDDWNLSYEDLKSLTISFYMTRSQGVWLFAMDDMCLAIGFFLAARLTHKYSDGQRAWMIVSYIASALAIINVGLEMARLGSWTLLATISGFAVTAFGLIVIPVWLIMLAVTVKNYRLPGSTDGFMHSEMREESGQSIELPNLEAEAGDRL